MIVPLMLVLFFGTREFSSGVAVDRKVTLMARTLSDLTSQNDAVTDTQLTNFFNASTGIMTPYPSAPVKATITELYVDPATLQARVQWSKGAAPRADRHHGRPSRRAQVGDTYLIFSEVSYKYMPTVGYVMAKAGHQPERLHLHPSAPVALRRLSGAAPVRHARLPDVVAPGSHAMRYANAHRTMQTKKGRAMGAAFRLFRGNFPAARSALENRFIRRRADCRPKICQSGDLPRFRRRSSGLHAAFQDRHARQR